MNLEPQKPLYGKTAAILGVADQNSIAWSIAKAFSEAGAEVIIGYQQKFYSRVRLLLEDTPNIKANRCDLLNPDEVESFFSYFQKSGLNILVHSIAYGPAAAFLEMPSQVHSSDFNETLEISTHSLAKAVKFAKPYLKPWSSILTLTFQASQKAMPLYGMMGVAKAALESLVRYLAVELGKDRIRMNAVSAGPVETLASLSEILALRRNPEAIKNLTGSFVAKVIEEVSQQSHPNEDEFSFARRCWEKIQNEFASKSAIPEKILAQDVADSALFFASDASKKITGQILHVDCGLSSCQLI